MKKNKGWLYLAILSFCVALIWASVSLIGSLRKNTIPADVQAISQSLDPNLNRPLLLKLEDRYQSSQRSSK